MIRAFTPSKEYGLRSVEDWQTPVDDRHIVWLDIVSPTRDELEQVRERVGFRIPDREELRIVESTSRLLATEESLIMSFRTLPGEVDHTTSRAVICVLSDDRLVTLRRDFAIGFDYSQSRLIRPEEGPVDAHDVLYGLIDAEVNRITERLEMLGHEIDTLMSDIFFADTKSRRSNRMLREVIHTLGQLGSRAAKIEDSLISLERLGLFLTHHMDRAAKNGEHRAVIHSLAGEVRTLGEYARGLDGKVDILLNASLGFVGVDQNQVMKTITIVAALFLPGTLVSSIFGMNFHDMPALSWHYGFFVAVGGSLATAGILAAIFRWLRWM